MAILDFFRPKAEQHMPPVPVWCVVTSELLDARSATAQRVFSSEAFMIIRYISGWTFTAYTEDGDPYFTEEQANELAAKLGARAMPRVLVYNKILEAKD